MLAQRLLQEIRSDPLRWDNALAVGNGVEDLRAAVFAGIEGEDRGDVAAAVAVVWRRPHGDELLVEHVFDPFVDELVSAADQLQLVAVHEVLCDQRSEQPARTAGTLSPCVHVFGIAPHQITEGTLVRDLDAAVDGSDLIQSLDLRAESTVNAQNRLVHNRCDGEQVEDTTAVLPGVDVAVLGEALVIEAVNLRNLS